MMDNLGPLFGLGRSEGLTRLRPLDVGVHPVTHRHVDFRELILGNKVRVVSMKPRLDDLPDPHLLLVR